ncbi:MAG: hypothetical protein Q7J85_12575 [Bacillota bacterium]|nr:hypothetical protein [Bacillota bacterium]
MVRSKLAKKHGTTIACLLTTGIFTWVAAHAAEEATNAGKENVTLYWRTLKVKGESYDPENERERRDHYFIDSGHHHAQLYLS